MKKWFDCENAIGRKNLSVVNRVSERLFGYRELEYRIVGWEDYEVIAFSRCQYSALAEPRQAFRKWAGSAGAVDCVSAADCSMSTCAGQRSTSLGW